MNVLDAKSKDFTDGFSYALALVDLLLHAGDAEQSVFMVNTMIESYQKSERGGDLSAILGDLRSCILEEADSQEQELMAQGG